MSTFRLSQRMKICQGIQRQIDLAFIRQHTGIQGMTVLLKSVITDSIDSTVLHLQNTTKKNNHGNS